MNAFASSALTRPSWSSRRFSAINCIFRACIPAQKDATRVFFHSSAVEVEEFDPRRVIHEQGKVSQSLTNRALSRLKRTIQNARRLPAG